MTEVDFRLLAAKHYDKASECLSYADGASGREQDVAVAAAQVHATLALACLGLQQAS